MKIKSTCLYCNNEFTYLSGRGIGKFCSNKCQGLYKRVYETHPLIERGEVDNPNTLKNYLTFTRGYKCEECDTEQWNGLPLSLHLDHIDGNSDHNFPSNIRLLCPNCHSQTETFSGRNKKNSKRSTYMRRYRKRKLVGDDGIEPPTFSV